MSRNTTRPNRVPCGSCNGQGSINTMGEETCPRCAGTGRDNKSDLWSEPCLQCNGRGKVYYCRHVPCRSCRGSGYTQY